jgi:hypothetical protein
MAGITSFTPGGAPSWDESTYANWSLPALLTRVGKWDPDSEREKLLFDAIIKEFKGLTTPKQEDTLQHIENMSKDEFNPKREVREAFGRLLDRINKSSEKASATQVKADDLVGLEGLGLVPSPRGAGSKERELQKETEEEIKPLPRPGSVVIRAKRQVPAQELFPTLSEALHQESVLKAFGIMDIMDMIDRPLDAAEVCLEFVDGIKEFFLKGDTLKKLYVELHVKEFAGLEQNRERIKAIKEYEQSVPRSIIPVEELQIAAEVLVKLYKNHKAQVSEASQKPEIPPRPDHPEPPEYKGAPTVKASAPQAESERSETIQAISSAWQELNRAKGYLDQANSTGLKQERDDLRKKAAIFAKKAHTMTKGLWEDRNALRRLARATRLTPDQLVALRKTLDHIKPHEVDRLKGILDKLLPGGLGGFVKR